MSSEQRKVENESRGCLLDGSEGEEAVFVHLCRPGYVAGLGTTGDVTSVYNCTMKIFTSQNFGFLVAPHLQIFKEAMLAFNLQIRRKCEDVRLCSVTNTHRVVIMVWLINDTPDSLMADSNVNPFQSHEAI
jgi:hypothetical protein